MQASIISKYRALLKLVPSLQKLADSGIYSWSALCEASTLNESYQEELFREIRQKKRRNGPEAVTKKWIQNQIAELKLRQKTDHSSAVKESMGNGKPAGIRSFSRASQNMLHVLTQYSTDTMKQEEAASLLQELQLVRNAVEDKIRELEQI